MVTGLHFYNEIDHNPLQSRHFVVHCVGHPSDPCLSNFGTRKSCGTVSSTLSKSREMMLVALPCKTTVKQLTLRELYKGLGLFILFPQQFLLLFNRLSDSKYSKQEEDRLNIVSLL